MSTSRQPRPSKRARLLSDDESSSDSGADSDGGVSLDGHVIQPDDADNGFKINSEYAKRFEHNKKREELHRLEEKYGKDTDRPGADADGSGSSEDSEDEDDEGELATRELDDEIAATLQAIRSKDKRVYDTGVSFYRSLDNPDTTTQEKSKKGKPVTLRDYHRQNLLAGQANGDDEAPSKLSYDGEQQALKDDLLRQTQEAKDEDGDSDGTDEEDNGFFKARPGQEAPKRAAAPPLDTLRADRDPETYLSNFLAARAWVPEGPAKLAPLDSDDDEDMDRADQFEQAYNLRFEDPSRANETLLSHSRKAVADYSVRREKSNPRKRAREQERAQKDDERRRREDEKIRLRNLKLEKASEKLKQFKQASGLRSKGLAVDEWQKFLDAGWDSDKWDAEMQKRFGDQYYADGDAALSDEAQDAKSASKKRVKKPKWDEDIDIDDIVPEFNEGQDADFSLSEPEPDAEGEQDDADTNEAAKKPSGRNKKLSQADKKREARKERRKLEELVDKSLATELGPSGRTGPFRYRETSPTTFGLNTRDILMADDSSLNQFAGLKKLAGFRDAERKKKDKRNLGKSSRLRQWRKETFGDEAGPATTFQDYISSRAPADAGVPDPAGLQQGSAEEGNVVTGADGSSSSRKKKKKRSRKRKGAEANIE